MPGDAEIGAHRPGCIGSDDDQAASGRGSLVGADHAEVDPERTDVVAEDPAQLVVAHLADEAGRAAEGRNAGHGVGRRPARGLRSRAHGRVELDGAFVVDERHGATRQTELLDEIVLFGADHVDDGIADADDVVLFHAGVPSVPTACRLAAPSHAGTIPT